MKKNLLAETEAILEEHGYSWRAVKFVANAEGVIEIASFVAAAKEYYYENDDQVVNVDPTLVIVGGTWWISRISGIQGERWLFHKKPQKPTLPAIDFSLSTHRGQNKINTI